MPMLPIHRLPARTPVAPVTTAAARTALILMAATPAAGLLGTADLAAQTPGHDPAVVEVPASARAVGLGNAYQVDSPDPDALFYNPALLARAGGFRAGVHVFGEDALGLTLSTARSFFGGDVGIGIQTLDYEGSAPGTRGGGLDPLVTQGDESVSEAVASLGYARDFFFGTDIGVTGKLITQRFSNSRQASGAVDVGLTRGVGPFVVSLVAQNIGPDRKIDSGEEIPQPLRGTLTVGGWGQRLGPLDIGLATALSVRDDEEVAFGGGLEVAYYPVVGRTFSVRLGGHDAPEGEAFPLTFGAGYWGDSLVIEYAFQAMDEGLDEVHRLTFGWR